MSGEPSGPHDGTPRFFAGRRRDQASDENEETGKRDSDSPASSDVSEEVAAFYPMSLLRALLREELNTFADTRLTSLLATELDRQLLTAELDKHSPAWDPRIRSSAVDTRQGESVSVDSPVELEELMPHCVPEPSGLRRPPRDALSAYGHQETAAWVHQATPETGVGDALINLDLAKSKDSWVERLVDDVAGRIDRLSDGVDRQCSFRLVELLEGSTVFNFVAGLVILANSIVMALSAEYDIQHIEDSHNQTYIMLELGFVVAYTLEWLIRACSGRCRFLGSNWCWFDMCILLGGWLEVGGGNSYISQFRIMQVLKVMRVVRLMRSFREVRVLVDSLMGSVRPLFWSTLIIAGIIFMFAILFVNSVAIYLNSQFDSGFSDIDTTEQTSLLDSWGSVPKSMYTLFSCASGGEDWRDVSSLLVKVGWDAFAYFIVFIVFFVFAITNSVCAFFVEAASSYANSDRAKGQQDRLHKKRKYVDAIGTAFRVCSTGSGYITKSDFMMMVDDKRMASFLAELDIDSLDLSNFFDHLSAQGKKAVDVEMFVEGCIRLCGQARSMDMLELLTQTEAMLKEMRKIRTAMEDAGMLRGSPNSAPLLR